MDHRTMIREFIIDNFLFGERERAPKDEDSFLELGIIDSTGILELVGFLEEKFRFSVKDDELVPENLDSVDNVVRYIEKKRNEGPMHAGA